MKQGQSIRCKIGRIEYDPEWSPTKPYKTYYDGTAEGCFESLSRAMVHLNPNGKAKWSDWK